MINKLNKFWKQVDAETAYSDFPKLDIQDIEDHFTFGPYSVTIAKRYIQEHLESGVFIVLEHKIHENIVRCQL